jgi:GntR family transcriptional regulator/MocR family aminotransferase
MALALAARALVSPGDVVAVEQVGYRPAWEAFRSAGATVVPIPIDGDGLDVEALKKVATRAPLRAIYVTPHHQYPTTVTLKAARRLALLALARAHRIAIVEDDYDHEFHYDGRPVLPLASADDTGLVVCEPPSDSGRQPAPDTWRSRRLHGCARRHGLVGASAHIA